MKFVKLYELKIFTAEDVQCGDEPFFKAVFKEARRLGLGGGTMVRADAGYGRQVRGNDGRAVPIFFSGSYNLPLIIEIVDTMENLELLYPFLEKNGEKHFLAVIVPLRRCIQSILRAAVYNLAGRHCLSWTSLTYESAKESVFPNPAVVKKVCCLTCFLAKDSHIVYN